MPKIGLCMIVKNEAPIIRRCLDSVLPLIDYVSIVDTGSSDGTQAVIQRYLREKDVPGAVIDKPWRDFAYNRTLALEALREQAQIDYALMVDADNIVVYAADFDAHAFKNHLHCDLYDVEMRLGSIAYMRPLLSKNHLPFSYRGVLHEYLDAPTIASRGTVHGLYVHAIQDSARSRNPSKFQDDAAVLEQALSQETDPFLRARYTFYLAQSYKDYGEKQKALDTYRKRAQLGFWDQEIFISLYYAAQLMEALGYPDDTVIQAYLGAFEACPTRVESLHGALRLCRLRGRYQQGYALGKQALILAYPTSGLFVENWIYGYGLLDEFAVVAYWAGHYRESLDACRTILHEQKIPQSELDRIQKNADFAIAKLREAGQLDSPMPSRSEPPAVASKASVDAGLRIANSDDAVSNANQGNFVTAEFPAEQIRLNLGCGRNPLEGWINVDSVPLPGVDLVFDLELTGEQRLPYPESSIDEFLLSHVIEHIRNSLGLMEELHRVAKPDAIAWFRVPHGASDDAFEDPTHVRVYFPGSFGYFSQPYYWRADYGFRGDWLTEVITLRVSKSRFEGVPDTDIMARIERERNVVLEMVVKARAVKPIRPPKRELQSAPRIVIERTA